MSGESFPLEVFMKNYATHLKPKRNFAHPNMIKHPDGNYSLTPAGLRFFASRLTSEPMIKGQTVTREEVIEMTKRITANEPSEGWQSMSVRLQDV